jgi:beta-lactamase regulating signal transducer with metallopeptidase domain
MSIAELAASAAVHALGGALLHFLWQGCAIAAALWLVLAGLPRSQAAARYAACCGALLGMLLAPAFTFRMLLAGTAAQGSALALAQPVAPQHDYFFLQLLALWALGSAGMTARLALGVAEVRRMLLGASPAPEAWQATLAQLAARMRLRQRVRLLVSDAVDAPVVLGWLRPVVLVPLAALTALPPASVEALLAHELGHVRRLDYLINVLQSCVEALLFYHPAVHWVSRCMRFEREHCCDDIAIQVSGNALRYARALADMEALRARIPALAIASKGGSLMFRIERILRQHSGSTAAPRGVLTATCVLCAALGLSLASVWACSSAGEPPASAERQSALQSPALPTWLPASVGRYQPTLAETAQRYGLDPSLLAIVTLVESLGDPAARSPAGALGLMQMMPSTAAKIAEERQLSGYSKQRLLEPEFNIDMGAYYLARQLDTFGSENTPERAVGLAAAAYNCGPKLMQAYLAGGELPQETQQYRDLVVGMWNERELPASPTYTAWRERLAQASAAAPR